MKVSEIRDKVITGSFAIGGDGIKEPCSALGMDDWEFYAKRLEVMVSLGEFNPAPISDDIQDPKLIDAYNATSTDDGKGEIETQMAWLERHLIWNREKVNQLQIELYNKCK
jgi:hypothetical protein